MAPLYPFKFFSRIIGIEQDNPDLCFAQYERMAKQTPLIILIVIVGICMVTYVNFEYSPPLLTVIFPIFFAAGNVVYASWFAHLPKYRSQHARDKAVIIRLHFTVWGTSVLGITLTIWTISLFGYGDETSRALTLLFVSTSAFGTALCMMHLRAASLSMMVSIIGPLVVYLWLTDIPSYMASSFNLALISGVIIVALAGYAHDIAHMIKQQQLLAKRNIEAKKLSEANIALANEDSLTGLANRRSFLSELNLQVSKVEIGLKNGLVVGVLDLDGFKLINDIYGHPTGDQLLKEVGNRLTHLLNDRLFVARLGGDEFGIVVSGDCNDQKLIELGQSILDTIQVPYKLDEFTVHLGGSIGFAKRTSIKCTASGLFEQADYALYHAKNNSRGGVVIFNEQHEATIRAVSGVDHLMMNADFEKEMSLVFQPIVSAKNETTLGFEVLARWHNPLFGTIAPDVFIRSAERAGLISRLTTVLLKKALYEAKNWPDDIYMSFNLSMQDIISSAAVLRLISIVNESGFDPKRITFEVTETAVMSDYERAVNSLQLLRNMGSKIALDDFGTGQSSLTHVRTLPLDKLKLDRSFITDIETQEDARAIVQAMVDMSRNLKIDFIVEGVETQEQMDILSAMDCELIQGYFFSKPLTGPDALNYISTERQTEMVG